MQMLAVIPIESATLVTEHAHYFTQEAFIIN